MGRHGCSAGRLRTIPPQREKDANVQLNPDDVRVIVENTRVVRPPKQLLATFGTTVVDYYVVTKPSYEGLPGAGDTKESVIRTGKVTAARPQIVTPFYLMNLFQGFEHGQEF